MKDRSPEEIEQIINQYYDNDETFLSTRVKTLKQNKKQNKCKEL